MRYGLEHAEMIRDHGLDHFCNVSFINFVDHKAQFGWHWPYVQERHKNKAITLFRDPVERLLSGFFFNNMLCGQRPRGMREAQDSWCKNESTRHDVVGTSHAYSQYFGLTS